MAVGNSYIDRIFADVNGHTGNVYYFRIVRRGDGKIWDNVAEELSDTTSWANSAIAMTEKGTTGQYPVVIPEDLIAGHTYEITVYLRAGGSPANTDVVKSNYEMKHGSIMGF